MRFLLAFLSVVALGCVAFAAEPTYYLTRGEIVVDAGETPPAGVAVQSNLPPLLAVQVPATPVRTAVKRMVQVCENGICRLVERTEYVEIPPTAQVQYAAPVQFRTSLPVRLAAADGSCGCGMPGCQLYADGSCSCGMAARTAIYRSAPVSYGQTVTYTTAESFVTAGRPRLFAGRFRGLFGRLLGGCGG